MPVKYVITENGNIKIGSNGQPTVVGDDEKEYTIDAIGAATRITELNSESADHRKNASKYKKENETLTTQNTDLQTTVDSIDDKNTVKIDELKSEINSAWEGKESAWNDEKKTLTDNLFDSTVGQKFASSAAVKTTILPPSIAKNTYGGFYKPDGSAVDRSGNPIYSKEKPGELATFEESLTILIDTDPDRDSILKGSGASGSGSSTRQNGDGTGTAVKNSQDKIKSGLAKL